MWGFLCPYQNDFKIDFYHRLKVDMAQKIKTNIKFFCNKIENGSKFYGLVAKINGCWKGCRDEDEHQKKIVLPIPEIASSLIENVLYICTLVPMRNDKGFVAVSAKPYKFKASIEAICRDDCNQVIVSFGNKKITYEPSNKEIRKNNIQAIAELLRGREDLESAHLVAEDFISAACMVKRIYESKQCS